MEPMINIVVPLPEFAQFDGVDTWQEAKSAIDKSLPEIESLAERAFGQDDRIAWETIQTLLYHWNLEELERLNPPTDLARTVRYVLRNAIIAIEDKYTQYVPLACAGDFTVEKAIAELRETALSHRINKHPLLLHMNEHGLPRNVVQSFLENYYVNNRVFHLHLAVLATTSPMNHRADIAKNFYDEMGAENGVPLAHPVLFLKNFDHIAFPETIFPLSESLYMLNTKIRHTLLSNDYRYGLGGLGFIELTMPAQMRNIRDGLEKSRLNTKDLIFWDLHIQIDEIHGETWFEEMREIITSAEDAYKVLNGGLQLLEARAGFYDGVWNYFKENEQAA